MKNKIKNLIFYIIINFILILNLEATEQFNFEVTEIEITQNGNKVVGKKRGLITTNDGLKIEADNFEYNKLQNTLVANGSIIIEDKKKDEGQLREALDLIKKELIK